MRRPQVGHGAPGGFGAVHGGARLRATPIAKGNLVQIELDAVEGRVLGALIEKQITTPDYYPLTLNALVNACNQTTNRDPVTHYDEGTVGHALEGLRAKGLAWAVSNSRAPKYGNSFADKTRLARPQVAVMCVLLLRGPQTTGEIRGRTGRLHEFASLEEVDAAIEELAAMEPPFVVKLPRAPGTKEARHAHLLGGAVAAGAGEAPAPAPAGLEPLERELAALRDEFESLRTEFAELKRRLE